MSKCIFSNHSVETLIEIGNFSLDHDLLYFTIEHPPDKESLSRGQLIDSVNGLTYYI